MVLLERCCANIVFSTLSPYPDPTTGAVTVTSAPTPVTTSSVCAAQFPMPTPGMDLLNWTDAQGKWSSKIEGSTLNIDVWAKCQPQFNFNDLLYDLGINDLPNQGKPFHVDGLSEEKAIWFTEAENRTSDDPVVLAIPGGGYYWGILPSHIGAYDKQIKLVDNPRLSWLVLNYTTTNIEKYPQQLKEAVAVYNELLKTTNNIIIFADSTGGHLASQLLIHMKNPYDFAPKVTENDAVKGLALSSGYFDFANFLTYVWAYNAGVSDLRLWSTSVVIPGQIWGVDWKNVLPDRIFYTYGQFEPEALMLEVSLGITKINSSDIYQQPGGQHDELVINANEDLAHRFANFFKSFD